MHSMLDQISVLLHNSAANSIQNNELLNKLPTAELFSNVLSAYTSGSEDANFAATGGNIFPPFIADNAATNTILAAASLADPLADELPASTLPANLVNRTAAQPKPLANALAQDKTIHSNQGELLNTSRTASSTESNESVDLAPQQTNSSLANNYASEISRAEINPTAVSSSRLILSQSDPVVAANQIGPQSTNSQNAEPQYHLPGNKVQTTPDLVIRQAPGDAANYTSSEKDPTSTNSIYLQSGVASNSTVADTLQSSPANKQKKDSGSTVINLLDSRERVLAPASKHPVQTSSSVDAPVERAIVDRAGLASSLLIEPNSKSANAERVPATIDSDESYDIPVTPKLFDFDTRKATIEPNAPVREQLDSVRLQEIRNGVQNHAEEVFKDLSIQDRPPTRLDSHVSYVRNDLVESAPVVKLVEININQKTPVLINIGNDASTSLKGINTEHSILSPRDTLLGESTLTTARSSEVRNGNEISEQIAWARQNNAQQIRISVSPEHLGAVDIKIDDAADGLNIQFVTQNAQAKEALESFMPRLKDMLEQSGLNLQNASVSQQNSGSSQFSRFGQTQNDLIEQDADTDLVVDVQNELPQATSVQSSQQLLDAFA